MGDTVQFWLNARCVSQDSTGIEHKVSKLTLSAAEKYPFTIKIKQKPAVTPDQVQLLHSKGRKKGGGCFTACELNFLIVSFESRAAT